MFKPVPVIKHSLISWPHHWISILSNHFSWNFFEHCFLDVQLFSISTCLCFLNITLFRLTCTVTNSNYIPKLYYYYYISITKNHFVPTERGRFRKNPISNLGIEFIWAWESQPCSQALHFLLSMITIWFKRTWRIFL